MEDVTAVWLAQAHWLFVDTLVVLVLGQLIVYFGSACSVGVSKQRLFKLESQTCARRGGRGRAGRGGRGG